MADDCASGRPSLRVGTPRGGAEREDRAAYDGVCTNPKILLNCCRVIPALLHLARPGGCRMNRLQREILHICGQAVAPVFRVPAIRDYAMRRAVVAAGVWDEDYPALEPKHLDNPRLFANREDLISSMRFAEGGVIAEIGVAHGEFSEYLLNQLEPKKFVAFDVFNLHEWDTFLHIPTKILFNNMTHLDYYKQKFADRGAQVVIEVGRSNLNLAKYPDKSFDLIYVDADHSYESVKQDADLAKAKLADNGVIVFNDYTYFDFLMGVRYGVVRAVNELIIYDDWRVCGFALSRTMYCDIAIRRSV
jgi:Methyltransferase domain